MLRKIRAKAPRYTDTNAAILIQGETGTGADKENPARSGGDRSESPIKIKS